MLTIIGCRDIVDIFNQTKTINCRFIEQGGVAKIVRHHDGRIKGTEIQSRNRDIIVTLLGLDDGGTFVLFVGACIILVNARQVELKITFTLESRNNVSFIIRSTEKLRQNFDRLATRKKVVERNTGDAGHLEVVHETHELVEQPLRKVCILFGKSVSVTEKAKGSFTFKQ